MKYIILSLLVLGTVSMVSADHAEVVIEPTLGSALDDTCGLSNTCYIPNVATVDVGGKVIFSNTDNDQHTFVAGDISNKSGEFDSGIIQAGESFEWTPTSVGQVNHFCIIHPWMNGIIIIQESKPAPITIQPLVGMMTNGEQVLVSFEPGMTGEQLEVIVQFPNQEHVNYDLVIVQNKEIILGDLDVHVHQGEFTHTTIPLLYDVIQEPLDISIKFKGYGIDQLTGPIDENIKFMQVIPEFPIAMLVMVVAIAGVVIGTRSKLVRI